MKLIILISLALFFIGCHSNNTQKEDNKQQETISQKRERNSIELKTSLNYDGTIMPSRGLNNEQIYVLTNQTCENTGNDLILVEPFSLSHIHGLLPFGQDTVIEKYSFCIEQKNGKTMLYMEEEFQRQFNKNDAISAMEVLVSSINKSKLGENIQRRNINQKSW